MFSQNGNQGMGKLVAKHSSDQRLGGRAHGLAQEGTVCGAGGEPGTAWPVCGHGEEVPVAGAVVQGCSSAGVLCNAGGQRSRHRRCSSGVGTGTGWAPSACHVPDWSGREWEGTECLQRGREQELLAQGVGLPSDCAARGMLCCRCSAPGLGTAGGCPGGSCTAAQPGQGAGVPLTARGTGGGSAPQAVERGWCSGPLHPCSARWVVPL